jgi:hypothetical protein
MQIFKITFLAFLLLSSCQSEQEEGAISEIAILDDAFIEMIDTVAYQYHSLRPAPNDIIYTTIDTLNVALTPVLLNIRKWEKEIIALPSDAAGQDRERIIQLLEKSKMDSLPLEFPVNRFRNTDRYKLFPYSKRSISIDTLSAIGKIEFTRTYFDDKYAITVATIRDHIKNGIVKLFLLEKRGSQWHKKEEFILEIW